MQAKRPYHHGHLREALLDAAAELIGAAGEEFTLREVARRAGVSHNAPYRHFRDKEDLLEAVAAQGFERLTASMRQAMRRGSSAEERLHLAGLGYVRFALRWPRHIFVMFELPLKRAPSEEYAAAANESFATLLQVVAAAQAEEKLPAGDPVPLALAAWCAVHGLAKLAISGRLPFGGTSTLRFTRYLTAVLEGGLRAVPHPAARRIPRHGAPRC